MVNSQNSQVSVTKTYCISAVTLITLLTTIGFQLVALLTTGWLHFRVGCRNSGLGVYVGLYQACSVGICVLQDQAVRSTIAENANHFEGQTVQDKVALVLISSSGVLLAIAFVIHCIILCRPKESLAKLAGIFCALAAVLVFCGCATWTGFLVYAEIADIWNTTSSISFFISLTTFSFCDFKFRLFKDYTSDKPFPLQYSFFFAWISLFFTFICIGLSSSVKQKLSARLSSAPIPVPNQYNVHQTTNVNFGNDLQPSAPTQPTTLSDQTMTNSSNFIMSQNLYKNQETVLNPALNMGNNLPLKNADGGLV